MSNQKRIAALRESTNPYFSDSKLKLGAFCPNLSYGASPTTVEGTLRATWPDTTEVARIGDEMGLEALFSVGRWRGFGGVTDFNEESLEPFTWAAGISALTKNTCVLSTSHVPTVKPVFAAAQGATIDHISGGRWALNVVTGWHQKEMEMFGRWTLSHDERYEMADEWLTIIKRLWTEDEEFDFEGRFFQISNARIAPRPIQDPYPVLINAAGSERGRHFAAKHCDAVFTILDDRSPEGIKAKVDTYRKFAKEEYNREVQVWCSAYVVTGDTEQAAKDFFDYYVNEKGDWEAAANLIEGLGINSKLLPPERIKALQQQFIAGYAGYGLIGTDEQITEELAMLSDCGLDGVLLNWAQYIDGIKHFQSNVMPLLQQAGLR